MRKPEQVSAEVRAGLERYARQHESEGETVDRLLADLRWDALMGCYVLERGTLTLGVELDGHVHS